MADPRPAFLKTKIGTGRETITPISDPRKARTSTGRETITPIKQQVASPKSKPKPVQVRAAPVKQQRTMPARATVKPHTGFKSKPVTKPKSPAKAGYPRRK